MLPKGDPLDLAQGNAFRMPPPGAKKVTFVDAAVVATRFSPGPAMYGLPSTLERNGFRMVRPFKEAEFPSYVPRPKDQPAPDAYAVDEYTKQTRLLRASESMPALKRALQLAT